MSTGALNHKLRISIDVAANSVDCCVETVLASAGGGGRAIPIELGIDGTIAVASNRSWRVTGGVVQLELLLIATSNCRTFEGIEFRVLLFLRLSCHLGPVADMVDKPHSHCIFEVFGLGF